MSYNHEGCVAEGRRNGKNILEAVGGRSVNYRKDEHFGKPASLAAEERERRQSKRWAKAYRKARRDAHYSSVPRNLTADEQTRNEKYWKEVKKHLDKGLTLEQARQATKIKPVSRREEYVGRGRR